MSVKGKSTLETSRVRHFTDLDVWKRSHELFLQIVTDVESFPRTRAAEIIADQVLRSCSSVSGNIAEGFNRSQKKLLNSLDIAIGEINETENWLLKLQALKYIPENRACILIDESKSIGKMLNGLIRSLKKPANA